MTAARRITRSAAVIVLGASAVLAPAAPASAHKEGRSPYRYVVAPPGFAGTTDNQMQLTLPAGALTPRPGERAVRVTLDQLDPADLPNLPTGLEPEGNAYVVGTRPTRRRRRSSTGSSPPRRRGSSWPTSCSTSPPRPTGA